MTQKEQILNLKDGECYVEPLSDYGKAEIWFKNYIYFLFEIPMFGGMPIFHKAYSVFQLDEMIDEINNFS